MGQYEECLSWSCARNLVTLDSNIERKKVNGIYGMYATKPISEGSVLASFPLESLLPIATNFNYPDQTHQLTKWAHAAAIELSKGNESEHFGYVMLFESLESLHQHSAYFFSSDELELIANMSTLCHRNIMSMKNRVNTQLRCIKELDPNLDEDFIIQAILNTNSRCWEEYGFLPIIDLFNHSSKKGLPIVKIENTESIGIKAKTNYSPGEQIFVSYGCPDIFINAVNFNFFDPCADHYIDYGLRAVQTIKTPSNRAIAEYIATLFKCNFFEVNGELSFQIQEPRLLFTANGPTQQLFNYFSKTSFCTQKEFSEKKCSDQSIYTTMIHVIDLFLSTNKVDNYKLEDVPKRLHRFHQLLKADKKLLLLNREMTNCYFSKVAQ